VCEGAILDVRGRLDRRNDALQIVCESVSSELPTASEEIESETVVIRFDAASDAWAEIRAMQHVDEILKHHEGPCSVVIEIPAERNTIRRLKSGNRRVEWSSQLEAELEAVRGVLAALVVPPDQARLAS
jgi:hypothetical protein